MFYLPKNPSVKLIKECIKVSMTDLSEQDFGENFRIESGSGNLELFKIPSDVYSYCALRALTKSEIVKCYKISGKGVIKSASLIFVATPERLTLAETVIALFVDDIYAGCNKVHYMGCAELLTLDELTEEANRFLSVNSKYKNAPYNLSRLTGSHCTCGENKGDFDLLPFNNLGVQEGQKRYMVCRKCGCISHL